MSRSVFVYDNWSSPEPVVMGILYIDNARGSEVFSFAYSDEYLRKKDGKVLLDPELNYYNGRQFTTSGGNFGIFNDSAPDRWGRMLMDRRERLVAREEGRKPRKLLESDYLLGVFDETRMGALRFGTEEGVFVSADAVQAVPPWTTLRTLEEASRRLEEDDDILSGKWLSQLLNPGSSLGGARPKSNVRSSDGSLWIAKFPSRHDEYDVGVWEMTVHELAKRCGINVPEAQIVRFSGLGSTFLVKRFDRVGSRRIHFASSMTLLGKSDGASASDGTGYLDIAEFIRSNGCRPKEDLTELWRRIVFNMAISNTDDHLRNHGFVLEGGCWRLSPAYDINPVPYGDTLSLNVSDKDNTIDIDLAIDASLYYGIDKDDAAGLAGEICKTVSDNWSDSAERNGASRSSIEHMRPAFAEAERCAEL